MAIHAQAYHRSPFEPLPAERTSQRRLSFTRRFTASAQAVFVAGQRDHEVRRDPQHVGLTLSLEELPQPGAAAVHLVAADEIEPQAAGVAVSADVRGQLPLGAELQGQRQAHDQRRHRILDVLAGYPLPRPGQRVPGSLPHIRQVHRVSPVRHPARAPHVLAFHPGRRIPGLLLAGLVDGPDHQPARRRPRRAASSRPFAANRRTSLIAASVSHDARFKSRWVRSGVTSPACCAIVHPFRFGISLTSADRYLPACCHVSVRAKHGLSAPISSARFRTARPAPILAAAAASDSFVLTST